MPVRRGCWAGGPCPQGLAEGSRGRCGGAAQEGSQHSPEAAEKVGVGVSRPMEEEREVGEGRRIIPLLPALWLTAGEKARKPTGLPPRTHNGVGMESGKMTAPGHLSSRFRSSGN